MINRLSTGFQAIVLITLMLLGGFGVFSDAGGGVTVGVETMHGAPPPPAPLIWDHDLNVPESSAWVKRFFGNPLSQYHVPNSTFRSASGPGFSLKAPGKLPGIEFNVEMHSLGALQSVVPPEKMPKGLNSQQEPPLLLPPSLQYFP